ncbi:rho GTPase-activating protein 40 isoform X2 [Oncorhynchus mykiss]|uniref:Rho-GAP domain-containing protein n=1 Tax=Oncorhynchus mykiss TaxID=8022 RepID=A0A8C7REI2_ONCMY|nr:rho GTPase-activating protein 40 isoform X2 [Oncorhynchus mykiss]
MGGRKEVVSRLAPMSNSSRQFLRHTPLNRLRLRLTHSPLSSLRSKSSSQATNRSPSPSEMNGKPWARPSYQDQAAAEHTQDKCTASHQEPQQQHPDKLCLDSFWSEVETIRSQDSGYIDLDTDSASRDSRHSEEGEQEEQWLQDAGLSTLIRQQQQRPDRDRDREQDREDQDVDQAILLSTLTRTQAAAVQRRLDSYTLSLRKRSKPPPRDVRDVFSSSPSSIAQTPLPKFQDPDPIEPSASISSIPEDSMETITKTLRQEVSLEQQHGGDPKEDVFITEVAYCEQAAILLKQAMLPQIQNNGRKRKEDGTLPRMTCPQCRLGVTRIHDLSNQDMKKVRQLALIEMTALCDLLELDVKRHKICKRKILESALYGVPLAMLLENDQKINPTATTPLILQALLSFLEKSGVDSEGILRVPGSQSRIKKLQQDLEQNFYSGGFSWEEVSPNDAAALVKKFIRELPSPLLTTEHLNAFSAVRDIPELKQKLHVLNLLILLLPEPNRNTLKALLEFLSKVVSRERRNRMNLWAVSTIMAPNLFLHKAVPSRLTDGGPGVEKGQAEKAADIMRLLIRYQDLLWTIPNFLMSQVRKLNENRNRRYQFYDRRIKNLLRKIHQDSKDKPDKNSSEPCRTVKIQVGDLMSSTMEVQVNISSRASDLLAQFHRHLCSSDNTKRNGSVSHPDCAIYEVGGNIGEHCLDPETHLLDLYNTNPSGEWVIKLKPLVTTRGLHQ